MILNKNFTSFRHRERLLQKINTKEGEVKSSSGPVLPTRKILEMNEFNVQKV